MTISMYKASVPIFVQFLTSVSAWLDKAAAHAEAKKIDPAALLNTRLFRDMFPLARQVRAATDHAINACGHLAGVELPTFANTEASIPELKERIAKAIEFIKAIKPAQIDGSEDKKITPEICKRRAQVLRAVAVAELLPAELLFSCHNRLRHPASERRRARQAGLHGNAAPALTAAMRPLAFTNFVALTRARAALHHPPEQPGSLGQQADRQIRSTGSCASTSGAPMR